MKGSYYTIMELKTLKILNHKKFLLTNKKKRSHKAPSGGFG